MERPFRCPACKFVFSTGPMEYRNSGFTAPPECPYSTTSYPELCSLHDKIYFGKWRKMDAEASDVRRAYERIARLLSMIKETAAHEEARGARVNIDKSYAELAMAVPEEEPFESVKYMDRASRTPITPSTTCSWEKGQDFTIRRTTKGITTPSFRSRKTGRRGGIQGIYRQEIPACSYDSPRKTI